MSAIDINTNFKFADLTDIGSPKSEYGLSKGLEEAAFNIPGGPDKINFYAQTNNTSDREAMIDVLTIYKKERARLEKIDNLKEDIGTFLKKEFKKIKKGDRSGVVNTSTAGGGGLPEADAKIELQKEIALILKKDPVTQELQAAGQRGGTLSDQIYEFDKLKLAASTPSPAASTASSSLPSAASLEKQQEDFVEVYDADPIYSKITSNIGGIDRIIFIVGTFFIRSIVLFMIEWAINSHMITTFQQCFKSYVVGYISLFLVWVLIANAGENKYEENILLNTLFYYINTRAHKSSTWRIGIHILIQVLLLPLLFIIKFKSKPIDQDSFEQRRAIYQAISNLTFFTWLITSIIASRF